jgi:ribulose-phosphate 3-epimerase
MYAGDLPALRSARSILSADFARPGEGVERAIALGADLIHVDVAPMVKPVEALIGLFADTGADIIPLHPEASEPVDRSLSLIRKRAFRHDLDDTAVRKIAA